MIQSTYFSPVFWNSLRFKRGPNFQGWGGKPIFQNNWIASIEGAWFLLEPSTSEEQLTYLVPLVYFNFKTFKDPIVSPFIRFPCVYDSEDFFVRLFKFLQIKQGGPNFWGRVYSAGKNFTGRINPALILPVKRKFYRQNKSRSYSAGKT